MSAGWGRPSVGDDVDEIMAQLQGDGDSGYPRGFAGLTVTSVTTLATAQIECKLSAWMRCQKLCLNTAALVDLCRVSRIDIGTIALNVGQAPVPAVCFARDAVGTQLDAAVWASPQVYPVVSFYNGTGGTIIVEGGMFGPVSRTAPTEGVAT